MIFTEERKLRYCDKGSKLLLGFLISTTVITSFYIPALAGLLGLPSFEEAKPFWIILGIIIYLIELFIFWDGIIRIYLTSTQLGIKLRIIGAIFGMILPINIIILIIMIIKVRREYAFEKEKIKVNEARKDQQICKTKYPILMVHGVFFRDFRYFNYWGRIPAELKKNGAVIYYGDQQSAESVVTSGKTIARKIKEICEKEGCEKVNIIGHSKGGLDSRWAISMEGMAPYVASLTTINSPHRGCLFAEYLLSKIPEKRQNQIASIYNEILTKLGDTEPDFLTSVNELTVESMKKFNDEVKDSPLVYYQSVGSKMNRRQGGKFPLKYSYKLVKHYDGNNDGLVGEDSCPWGQKFQFLTTKHGRGISHGDMIDLYKENLKEFDVREFYVQLVKDLKDRGF
ncbi:MAG: hypothetical protein K6C97_08290 [Treponema sp.]|nr:hypothetical protein [Treponema sp.]